MQTIFNCEYIMMGDDIPLKRVTPFLLPGVAEWVDIDL